MIFSKEGLTRYVEEAFEDDGNTPFLSGKFLLLGISKLYSRIMAMRETFYKKRTFKSYELPVPTLSVGNITAGGTGKTPMTLCIAAWLQSKGAKVAIVSRGYGGALSKEGAMVSDGTTIHLTAAEAGDEPLMMAEKCPGVPVMIGSDRVKAAQIACQRFSPDVIILDDAFQHLRLKRHLNLLLADANRPFGNGHLIPRGSLREPLTALKRADAVVLTRSREGSRKAFQDLCPSWEKPVLCATHALSLGDAHGNETHPEAMGPVFLVSGIAKNHAFVEGAKSLGVTICGAMGFADHHPYTEEAVAAIEAEAKAKNAAAILTTDKDLVKLKKLATMPLFTVTVNLDLGKDFPELERLLAPLLP